MNLPWDGLAHIQNFFQLDFLFSGLEVSSTAVFVARILVLLLFGFGLVWAVAKIILKLLDCLQTFLGNLGQLPRSFFLLLLLVVPLSSESLGAQWIGYILLVFCLLALAATGALIVVLWKYGVDHALRLIDNLRSRPREHAQGFRESSLPPDNIVASVSDPVEMPSEGSARSWPRPG
ncbi:MAG: hypothetical protein P8182_09595 [Deltaproteobacteria bacterium]